MEYLPIAISGVCAILLFILIIALVVNKSFRDAVLGGEGEAIILGLISVKGVAIVLLCALFLGGLIYPLTLNVKGETEGFPEMVLSVETTEDSPPPNATTENVGITLLSINTTLDLSNRIDVPRGVPDNQRLSPAVRDVKVIAQRDSSNSKYIVFEHASVGKVMDITCLRYDCTIYKSSGTKIVGDDSRTKWTIVADISRHSLNLPFDFEYRAIYWNTFQPRKDFSGFITRGNHGTSVFNVKLPKSMMLTDAPTFEFAAISDSPHWRPATEVDQIHYSDARISWTVEEPKTNHVYRVNWEWGPRLHEKILKSGSREFLTPGPHTTTSCGSAMGGSLTMVKCNPLASH